MNPLETAPHRADLTLLRLPVRRGLVFGVILLAALFAFEAFNYSTTEFALIDLLGDLKFIGIRWATILAIAFCGIDFAGLARLFTPEAGQEEPAEVWYLFAAWLLAATMNAMLTWWGVSIALLNHPSSGSALVPPKVLLRVVPVFVAIMVWLIRVLMIGTFAIAGQRLFSQGEQGARLKKAPFIPRGEILRPAHHHAGESRDVPVGTASTLPPRPASKPGMQPEGVPLRSEPVYQPVGMEAGSAGVEQRGIKG